jgi:hypothetical protein
VLANLFQKSKKKIQKNRVPVSTCMLSFRNLTREYEIAHLFQLSHLTYFPIEHLLQVNVFPSFLTNTFLTLCCKNQQNFLSYLVDV